MFYETGFIFEEKNTFAVHTRNDKRAENTS